MQEYRIEYFDGPYGYGPKPRKIMFIEADSVENAEIICRNHYERRYGVDGGHLRIVRCALRQSLPHGRVLEG